MFGVSIPRCSGKLTGFKIYLKIVILNRPGELLKPIKGIRGRFKFFLFKRTKLFWIKRLSTPKILRFLHFLPMYIHFCVFPKQKNRTLLHQEEEAKDKVSSLFFLLCWNNYRTYTLLVFKVCITSRLSKKTTYTSRRQSLFFSNGYGSAPCANRWKWS